MFESSDQDYFSYHSAKCTIHLLPRQQALMAKVAMVTTINTYFQFQIPEFKSFANLNFKIRMYKTLPSNVVD